MKMSQLTFAKGQGVRNLVNIATQAWKPAGGQTVRILDLEQNLDSRIVARVVTASKAQFKIWIVGNKLVNEQQVSSNPIG